jgi:hypothetical protein
MPALGCLLLRFRPACSATRRALPDPGVFATAPRVPARPAQGESQCGSRAVTAASLRSLVFFRASSPGICRALHLFQCSWPCRRVSATWLLAVNVGEGANVVPSRPAGRTALRVAGPAFLQGGQGVRPPPHCGGVSPKCAEADSCHSERCRTRSSGSRHRSARPSKGQPAPVCGCSP